MEVLVLEAKRMFNGEYNHTVDTKGRLIIPTKFRDGLGEEFKVTRGLDGCLFAFPLGEWSGRHSFGIISIRAALPECSEQIVGGIT